MRFTKTEAELTFAPARFIAIDTEMGILEIRSYEPYSTTDRSRIMEVAIGQLGVLGVKVLGKFPRKDLSG